MSAQIAPAAEHVCYVHCNFCNTVLAVYQKKIAKIYPHNKFVAYPYEKIKNVPGNSVLTVVTVRCGHCTNLLSVNLRGLMQSLPAEQEHLQENIKPHGINGTSSHDHFSHLEFGSSSSKFRLPMMYSAQNDHLHEQALAARPPEKRQRVPSAYNRFIKEEIRRIKANNPDISHREAFSTAAKNWAHYPNIHFGLSPDREGSKKLVDETVAAVTSAPTKIQGFY